VTRPIPFDRRRAARHERGITRARDFPMQAKLLRGLIVVLIGYLLLVAAHFIYLEIGGRAERLRSQRLVYDSARLEMPAAQIAVRNYASAKFELGGGAGAVDQKYEKIAHLHSTTSAFDEDDRKARVAVRDFHGLIQEESLSSERQFRSLRLTIGIPPAEFDAAVAALRKIGEVESFGITKNDRTNDYLQLQAKRTSLEKARDALVSLKTQGGKIDEFVKLEHEILELEGKIQELGVQLGHYDRTNEFCTVHLNLAERAQPLNEHEHFANFLASLAWASGVYLGVLGAATLGLVCLLMAALLADKAKSLLSAPGK
jgi:hypothetical protein